MRFTDPSLLPVPGDKDTGATALFLQSFAERTEAILSPQYAALNDHLTSPMFIMTNSGVINISNSFSVDSFGSTVTQNVDTYRTNNGPALSRALYRTGLWHLGWYFSATTVTPGANTYRRGHMDITANDILINNDELELEISYSLPEKQNGANSLSAEAFFYVPPGTPAGSNGAFANWSLGFSHGNAGAVMTIAAGAARTWGMWVSDDNLIRGV